ncbi:MAG: universal stress protein [Aeromicrobium sp.]|uniref:universal stress protein n=1 Tax=Aeromicrobium sp. TaxID=1871063 RepID=UPI0039E4A927
MTIVVAYAPDQFGAAALDAALELAAAGPERRRVVVVNATKGDALVDARFADAADLVSLESVLAEASVPTELRQPVGADAADAVLDVAGEVGASVVVVGLRPRTPVGKMLMGSVAQRILLDATMPVLAVKPGQPRPW